MRRWGRTLIAIAVFRASLGALILATLTLEISNSMLISLIAFSVAQLSDHLDGWIARRHSSPTLSGYLQDSISDKLLHIGCLLGLGVYFPFVHMLLWCLIARELVLMGLRVAAINIGETFAGFRRHSIVYAVFVRGGIVALFLSALVSSDDLSMTCLTLGHVLLFLAVICGTASNFLVFRSCRTAGFRRE